MILTGFIYTWIKIEEKRFKRVQIYSESIHLSDSCGLEQEIKAFEKELSVKIEYMKEHNQCLSFDSHWVVRK